MPETRDRIFISIGVSRPDGGLAELPGAITASERMAAWAEANGYISVIVNDAVHPSVTIDLLREKITAAIEEVTGRAVLQRLVIFFAGHGASLGIDDQNWLLSKWKKRSTEAVNIASLARMLEYHGPRQVTIIGDACQEFSARFMEVVGGAVLDTTEEDRRGFELDKFFPVDSGSAAYMIKAKDETKAFCLFTEVLLDALEGDAPEKYFEKDGIGLHVTSQSLARFLSENLAAEAGKYGVVMQPRPRPGFYSDRTYLTLPHALPQTDGESGEHKDAAPAGQQASDRKDMGLPGRQRTVERIELAAPSVGREPAATGSGMIAERRKQEESDYAAAVDGEVRNHFETGCGICFTGAPVELVQASRGWLTQDWLPPNWYRLNLSDVQDPLLWADVVVDLADGSVASACVVQNFVTAMHVFDQGEANVLHRPLYAGMQESRPAIDLLARLHAGTLTEVEIVDAAAMLRLGKHRVLTLGAVAAQFYDSVRDTQGLRSIASFYAQARQPIPLDIVLFGGGRLFETANGLVADIPATEDRQPRSAVERERWYSHNATPAIFQHPVAGRVPWMRQAWSAVATAECDASAREWRDQALAALPHLGTGLFTVVRPEGGDALITLAGITSRDHWVEPEMIRT